MKKVTKGAATINDFMVDEDTKVNANTKKPFYDTMLPRKIDNLVKGSIMTSEFPVNNIRMTHLTY